MSEIPEKIKIRFEELYDINLYELSGVYTNNKSFVQVLCKRCNNNKSVVIKSVMDEKRLSGRCTTCDRKRESRSNTLRYNWIEFDKVFSKNYPDFTYIKNEEHYSHKGLDTIKVTHKQCNNEFLSSPNYWTTTSKITCRFCSNINRKEHIYKMQCTENYLEKLEEGTDYKFLEDYKGNNKIKHKILHKECNRTYDVRPNDFQQGYKCPHCSLEKTESYACSEITKHLTSNNIDFMKEVTVDGCKFVNDLIFDFSIPLSNKKVLLIEYDGEQHFRKCWNSDFETVKQRDRVKDKFVKENSDRFILERIHYKENHIDKLKKILKKHFN